MGRIDVRVEFVPFTGQGVAGRPRQRSLPKGASPGLDWPRLIETVLGARDKLQPPSSTSAPSTSTAASTSNATSLSLPGLKLSQSMHQVCFVENKETDTQVTSSTVFGYL